MLRVGPYTFKRAETPLEFEQIHRLNYRTFVGEIPQHADTGTGQLIDKFHDKNHYFIVVEDHRVIGMVSGHDQPPFSIASRLPNLDLLKEPGCRPMEARLLAVEHDKRNTTLFFGLVWSLYEHARVHGYTHLFISAVKERYSLYQRLGFKPLGPAVPCGQASFVPMVMIIGKLPARVDRIVERWNSHVERVLEGRSDHVCLLPGPVTTSPAVQRAFHQPAIYHRGPEFISLFQKVRRALGALVGGKQVALLNGSGTLANESVAACLAADPTPPHLTLGGTQETRGVMLVNGEFGHRLAVQATRFGLRPRILKWTWGQSWDLEQVDAALAEEPAGSWVWGVHLESSTGVLNDLPGLVRLARRRGIRVCADCISSLGAVPLDLSGVFLATGASGKSLGSYAGTAIVFASLEDLLNLDLTRVPSYFDIPAALQNQGPRYTFPSATLVALQAALENYSSPQQARARYDIYAGLGKYVREQLRKMGLQPLADERWACPVVTTFSPPGEETSEEFVRRCQSWGFTIGGQSGYLAERRLVQIATMGAVTRENFAPLFEHLDLWLPQAALAIAGAGV